MTDFHGVMPPIPTPFNQDYSINIEALRGLVEHLITGGVHAIIPTGSTGEFARLSIDERKEVLEICLDQTGGRIPVIAGTAAPGTREVIELSAHAESAGAAGLQIVAPFYGRPNDEEILNHYRQVAESVNIPILIYNNPGTTGIDISPALFQRLADIPNISGVKEATGDSRRIRQIINLCGDRLDVYVGTDDNVLEAFALGAKGWVAGTANLLPERCVAMYEAAVVQDDYGTARSMYYEMSDLCDTIESAAFVQNIKAGLEIIGIEAGPPRPPLLPPGDEERQRLRTMLAGLTDLPA